jgi:type II secretory pathway pseudopilin PulG
VGINDTNNNIKNEGGNTIGVIDNKIVDTSGNTSGTTSYQKVMDGFFDNAQKYMDTVLGKTKQITNDFNLPLAQLFTTEVNYSSGKAIEFGSPTPLDLKIYGKPDNVEQRVKSLYDKVVSDINSVNSSTDAGFNFINVLYSLNFSKKKIIKIVKQNLIKALDTAQKDIITALSQTNQTTTDVQQSLVRLMSKIDFVVTNSDGYIKSDQTTKIYNITATTEVQSGNGDTYSELVNDYSSGVTQLYSFYNELKNQKLVEYKFDSDNIQTLSGYFTSDVNPEKRFYTLMGRVIINSNYYPTFRDSVITANIANELGNNSKTLMDVFNDEFQYKRNRTYTEEHDDEVKYLDKLISDKFATYSKSFTQLTGKTRKFTFSDYISGTTVQSTRLQNIYKDGNSNPDKKTFNGKNKFN